MPDGIQARAVVEIALHGAVGGDFTTETVSAALKAARGAPVTISLHSYGGDAMAGVAIHNMLARYAGRKTIVIEGVAASAGSLIAMAGDTVQMPANALLMIHEAWSAALGGAEDMRKHADLLDTVSTAYRRTYAARTGKTEDEIAALMAAETWFTAEEAVEAGFADAIIPARPARALAGADKALAQFRNPPAALAAFVKKEPSDMDGMNTPPQAAASAPASLTEIEAIGARAGLGAEWVLATAKAGLTLDSVRDAAIDAVAAQAATPPIRSVHVTRDEGDVLREAETDYLAARLLNRKPQGAGQRFAGCTLLEVAAQTRGMRVTRGMGAEKIFAMLTTSDIPLLTSSALNRAMVDLWPLVRTPLLDLAEKRDLPDFRPVTTIRLAQHAPLDQVEEGAEVTAVYPTEAGETIRLAQYSNLHILSRQVIVNDDLGGLSAWLSAAAQAAAARERLLVSGLLTEGSGLGPLLSDGARWFAAGRNNIASPTAIDSTSIGSAVALMRALRDASDQPVYALEPYAIVCSPAYEMAARKATATLETVTDRADVQPYNLRVIVEPALTGNRWWLACRPELRRCIAVGYLNGMETPNIETFTEPGRLGTTVRVTFDCAAAVQDPIGWVTNAGA